MLLLISCIEQATLAGNFTVGKAEKEYHAKKYVVGHAASISKLGHSEESYLAAVVRPSG